DAGPQRVREDVDGVAGGGQGDGVGRAAHAVRAHLARVLAPQVHALLGQRAGRHVGDGPLGQDEVLPAGDAHAVAVPAVGRLVGIDLLAVERAARDVPERVVLHAAVVAAAPVG